MLKYVYFGTPKISKDVLQNLVKKYGKPELVVTSLDTKSGRGLNVTPPPVKEYALQNKIEYLQPEKLIEIKPNLENLKADVGVLFAYGKIIPQWLLEIFPCGIINVHPSLLPLYRGASPLTGPILNGDNVTGVTIMDMDKYLDHGDIYVQNKIELKPNTNRLDLEQFTIETAPELLVETLNKIEEGNVVKTKQIHELATYTKKIKKEEGEIKESDSDEIKYRKYKAFIGWPGVYFFNKNSERIKITDAEFTAGKFIIKKVIPEGGKEIDYKPES